MYIIWGFFYIVMGVFFVWIGSFMLITSMVSRDAGIYFAEKHGEWMRENVFRFPPTDKPEQPQGGAE